MFTSFNHLESADKMPVFQGKCGSEVLDVSSLNWVNPL